MAFVTPCRPAPGRYTISVELLDGRKSALTEDIALQHLRREEMDGAQFLLTDRCVQDGTVLLNGVCRPCPEGELQPPSCSVGLLECNVAPWPYL